MGPRNSKESSVSFMTDYKVIQQNVSDNITYLQHKQTDEEYLLKQFTYNDKKQCEKMMQRLADLKTKLAGNKHVVPLKDYLMSSEDQYCSTFYKIYALFQYPQRTLDEEISQRKLHKKKFAETQLWSILASCIVGLSHLQKNGIKHAALRSNNILLSREGVIKIADPFGIGQTPNYDTVYSKRSNIASSSSHIYLSPEQTQALQQEQIAPVLNPFKSDIWTLGMIVLEAGLLQYQDDQCYRDEKSRIHWQTVQYNIDRLGQAYSDQMKHMIQFMLSRDERARPDWVELQEHVMKNGDQGRRSFIQEESKIIQNNLHIENDHINVNQNKAPIGIQVSKTTPVPIVQQNTFIYSNNQQKTGIFSQLSQTSQNQRVSGGILNNPNNHAFVSSYQTGSNMNTTFGKLTRPDSPKVPLSNTAIYNGHSGTQTPNQIKPTNIQTNLVNTPNLQPYNQKIVQNVPVVYTQPPVISQLGSVNYGYSTLTPLRPSNIENTRPMKNIFPTDQYTTKTKYDQNLILMVDDEASQTSERNYINEGLHNTKFYSNGQNRQGQTNNTSPIQRYNNNYSSNFTGGGVVDNRQNKNSQPLTQYNQYTNKQQNYNSSGYNPAFSSNNQLKYVTQQFKMGSRYEGYKLNGMRHGYGKFYYQDGGMYDGDWKENKMEGYGKLFYQSGKLAYQGQWRSDQFMGKGILYNQLPEQLSYGFNYNNFDDVQQFWTKYEGQFLDDMKNGRGILYLSNGERFQGNFVSDCVQGPGIFFCKNGERVLGTWGANIKIN